MSLGITLLVVVIVAVLAFALSALSVTNSQLLTHAQQEQVAENMAQSATRLAIERLLNDPNFGLTPQPTLVVTSDLDAGSQGRVAFDPAQATLLSIPVSFNNLNGASAVSINGESLAPGNARLLAEGRCGNARKVLECTLNMPSFPYAVASSGSISCSGGITVAAVDSISDLARIGTDPTFVPGPASISSNCPQQGIALAGLSLISGDLESAGKILVDTDTRVLGQIRESKDSLNLPAIEPAAYDPASFPGCNTVHQVLADQPLRDVERSPGSLTVDGNLTLSGGDLYVQGNLNVKGAISGVGAVITTGNLTVGDAAQYDANSRAALVCGGDLNIAGSSRSTSFLRGLVFCKGHIKARQITILGALLCGGADVNSEQINLFDATIVPQTTSFSLASGPPVQFDLFDSGMDNVANQVSFSLLPGGLLLAKLSTGESCTFDPSQLDGATTFISFLYQSQSGSNPAMSTGVSLIGPPLVTTTPSEFAGGNLNPPTPLSQLAQNYQNVLSQLRDQLTVLGAGPTVFTLDPSQCLQWRDRVKIVRWRTYS